MKQEKGAERERQEQVADEARRRRDGSRQTTCQRRACLACEACPPSYGKHKFLRHACLTASHVTVVALVPLGNHAGTTDITQLSLNPCELSSRASEDWLSCVFVFWVLWGGGDESASAVLGPSADAVSISDHPRTVLAMLSHVVDTPVQPCCLPRTSRDVGESLQESSRFTVRLTAAENWSQGSRTVSFSFLQNPRTAM